LKSKNCAALHRQRGVCAIRLVPRAVGKNASRMTQKQDTHTHTHIFAPTKRHTNTY